MGHRKRCPECHKKVRDVGDGSKVHKCKRRRSTDRRSPLALPPRPPPSPPPNGMEVTDFPSLCRYVRNSNVKNVVVLMGAGASTPCGIPDFQGVVMKGRTYVAQHHDELYFCSVELLRRTPGTSLHKAIQKYNLPAPECMFEMDYFKITPRPFFTLAKIIYSGNFRPGLAHYFVKLLEYKEKLSRLYTQNIDGLEKLAGISDEKLIEAHGSLRTATCLRCKNKYDANQIKPVIFQDKIPKCKQGTCRGIVKPDVLFYNEPLPGCFRMCTLDMDEADLMIIIGTSLTVEPFASLIHLVKSHVPRVLIDKNPKFHMTRVNDITIPGDIDDVVPIIAEGMGWRKRFKKIMDAGEAAHRG